MTTQQERLRSVAASIRTKPTPLSDFIPLMTKTADHIDKLEAELEQIRKDAERYRWLAKYLVSDDDSHDDALVAATTVAGLDYVIDAAMKGTP